MKGEIKPSDKLPSIENIAKMMGTSAISAREGVKSLAAIGLVSISQGKGVFMTEGAPVIEELFEARKVIESHNAMMAALNIESAGLAHLEHLLREMNKDMLKGDIDSYSELDCEFHFSIGKTAGNRILFKTLENIEGLIRYQQSTINRLPNIIQNSSTWHQAIFDAIKKKDADSAMSMMSQHIAEVIELWKSNIG
jgi:DNA-binding FadR family transcriptional regulator